MGRARHRRRRRQRHTKRMAVADWLQGRFCACIARRGLGVAFSHSFQLASGQDYFLYGWFREVIPHEVDARQGRGVPFP